MEQETKEECPLCGQEMNDEAKAEKAKIDNLKELYKRYCTCRDQELDRFWKNSVFVWCFLLLCFGAFGKILIDYLSNSSNDCDIKICDDTYEKILTIIAFLGFFISQIWVWMARGLKAWYEVYESAIWDMESNKNVFGFDRNYTIENYWSGKENGFKLFVSNSYSPSKIVILIGYLLSFIWFIAYCSFLFISLDCIFPIKTSNNDFWVYLISCIIFFVMLIMILKYKSIKSSYNIMGNLIIMLIFFVILYIEFDCEIEKNIVVHWKFLCVLILSGVLVYICSIFIKSSSLRSSKEDTVFKKVRTRLNTFHKNQGKNLYFEVKDNYVKFFFANKDEKKQFQNMLSECIKFTDTKSNWFKKKWGNIIEWFKSEYSDTDFTYSINIKDKILNEAEESNENTNINTTDNETTNKKEN